MKSQHFFSGAHYNKKAAKICEHPGRYEREKPGRYDTGLTGFKKLRSIIRIHPMDSIEVKFFASQQWFLPSLRHQVSYLTTFGRVYQDSRFAPEVHHQDEIRRSSADRVT
ncbi:hypothetical protein RUM43_001806 [Polyplax serrata]|uniref:Uncharacterized protein n=1 Tax=Polyplax serrata TaxID=468196 RepID=A0AAN8SG26_POLSC